MLSCFRAHFGRRERDRREESRTGGQEREGIWVHFNACRRILDGEMKTGGRTGGQGDRRVESIWAHFHAFERIWDGEMGTGVMREGQGDKRGRAFGSILMLAGAFGTER